MLGSEGVFFNQQRYHRFGAPTRVTSPGCHYWRRGLLIPLNDEGLGHLFAGVRATAGLLGAMLRGGEWPMIPYEHEIF